MTHHQFVRALNALELGHASQRTAALLGVKVRQLNKLKTGKQKVSETMRLLLNMYRKHGLPAEPGIQLSSMSFEEYWNGLSMKAQHAFIRSKASRGQTDDTNYIWAKAHQKGAAK